MATYKALLKRLFVHSHDLIVVSIAWYLAYWSGFIFGHFPQEAFAQALKMYPYVVLTQWLAFLATGVHRCMWRFTSLHDFLQIIKSVIIGTAGAIAFAYYMNYFQSIPRIVFPNFAILTMLTLSSSRFVVRCFREYLAERRGVSKAKRTRVLIVGAGRAGEGMVRDIRRSRNHNFIPVAFVDDKLSKQGQSIHGVRVIGQIKDIPQLVKEYAIDHLMLAIPSLVSKEKKTILNICKNLSLPISTLPSLNHIVAGKVSVDLLRDLSIEDLIGRAEVKVDWDAIGSVAKDKVVLVTGAGGSIGSELCRQLAKVGVTKLVAIDNSEFNLFTIEQELTNRFLKLDVIFKLKDIRDIRAIEQVFKVHKPDIVFHAAAYKHVPMMENHIREAVYNNVVGTHNVVKCALEVSSDRFVLVSTDKAVNPSNIMGATKRLAEIICQIYSREMGEKFSTEEKSEVKFNDKGASNNKTKFVTVRFGNVIDSAGSVIPTFRRQIEQGGPITVTHPNVTRFFMTIPEASQLILQAVAIGNGGEIFILDMGEAIKIVALAEQLVNLSGKVLGEDIEIEYTGLRPGEKMVEELFHESEELEGTPHAMILKARSRACDTKTVKEAFFKLKTACEKCDEEVILPLVKWLVPEYEGK